MKTTFRFIIAAMAAIAVFSSCRKELVNESANKTTDGVRTISVLFDNSTKASLNDLKPAFTNGDEIRVSNDTESEECTVTVSGAGATFTTTLSGALTAIYPADAAVLASEAADAPIASSNNFKVSANQDGTVAKAIIASATVAEGENTATFNVLTALFEITPPDDVTTFTIKSLKPVVDGVARTGDAVAINTEGADAAAKRVITVTVPSGGGGKAYVALVPGVNLTDLSFEYTIDATRGAMKGIPTKDITTDATAANTKYTIGKTGWHLYVKIQMTINGDPKTYKWATMNVGATDTDPYGTYFMWGAIDKAYTGISSNTFTFGPKPSTYNNATWNASKCFAWDNCPWTNDVYDDSKKKNVFTKYIPSGKSEYWGESDPLDNKTTLDLADDAANANWGGSWRMPTIAEFDALINVAGSAWDGTGTVKGYRFGTSTNQIFLPAAGYGGGTNLYGAGDYGNYWSSSLHTGNPNNAYYLYFSGSINAFTNFFFRYGGHPVRALSE